MTRKVGPVFLQGLGSFPSTTQGPRIQKLIPSHACTKPPPLKKKLRTKLLLVIQVLTPTYTGEVLVALHALRHPMVHKSSCTVQGTPNSTTDKLLPLPIPQRLWSHLAIDFVTDLPCSQGNTVIMVLIDRFSKSDSPLRSPLSLRTAELICDQGDQFTAQVWSSFMEKLGASVSLTSG